MWCGEEVVEEEDMVERVLNISDVPVEIDTIHFLSLTDQGLMLSRQYHNNDSLLIVLTLYQQTTWIGSIWTAINKKVIGHLNTTNCNTDHVCLFIGYSKHNMLCKSISQFHSCSLQHVSSNTRTGSLCLC